MAQVIEIDRTPTAADGAGQIDKSTIKGAVICLAFEAGAALLVWLSINAWRLF